MKNLFSTKSKRMSLPVAIIIVLIVLLILVILLIMGSLLEINFLKKKISQVSQSPITEINLPKEETKQEYQIPESKKTPITPSSEFGKAFHQFLAPIISRASEGEAILTSYNETTFMGELMVNAEYTLPSPVSDLSKAVEEIKKGFSEQGIVGNLISTSISENEASLQLSLAEKKIGGKIIGQLMIGINKNSDIISISAFVANP